MPPESLADRLCLDPSEANIGIEAPLFKDTRLTWDEIQNFFNDARQGASLADFVYHRRALPGKGDVGIKICGIQGGEANILTLLRLCK